jgi:hypothetical protein
VLLLLSGLSWPGMASAEAVAVSVQPTLDREIDAALAASTNVQVLFSGETAPDPSSPEWAAALATERGRLAVVLRALGYLDARIDVIESAAPASVRFRPVTGPLYRIALIEVAGVSGLGDEGQIHDIINSAIGEPPRGDVLTRVTTMIRQRIRDSAYPYAEVAHEMEVDRPTATVFVRLSVSLGTKVRLGRISYEGAKATDPLMLERLHPFSVGTPYTQGALEALRVAVEGLPLVRRARVELEDGTDANGLVPVRVTIAERADPARLGHLKLAGSVALVVALAALSLRQWVQIGQRRPSVQVVQSIDLAVLVLLITALALVLERALSFLE